MYRAAAWLGAGGGGRGGCGAGLTELQFLSMENNPQLHELPADFGQGLHQLYWLSIYGARVISARRFTAVRLFRL